MCPELPLLDQLRGQLGPVDERTRIIVGLQHLLGSTVTLIDALMADRVAPSDVFLLGKPYSTSPRVETFLKANRAYWVHPASTVQEESSDNDSEMDQRIEELLERVEERLMQGDLGPDAQVLLIDDGGRAIRVLHTPRFAAIRSRFRCVEQTRCGIRALQGTQLEIPVVNVAECWAKLGQESPHIAESVKHELARQLWAMSAAGIPISKSLTVIGYGAIGRAVAREYHLRGHRVRVYDSDAERLQLAVEEGLETMTELRAALRAGGVIVGCTGLKTVGPSDYGEVAHNAILVSASSSDVEFQAWNLRRDAICLGSPLSWRRGRPAQSRPHPCFSLYRVHGEGRGFYLVNGGFPVNFTGEPDPIAPSRIQLTRALLYLGAWQASHDAKAGIHALSDIHQQFLVSNFQQRALPDVA